MVKRSKSTDEDSRRAAVIRADSESYVQVGKRLGISPKRASLLSRRESIQLSKAERNRLNRQYDRFLESDKALQGRFSVSVKTSDGRSERRWLSTGFFDPEDSDVLLDEEYAKLAEAYDIVEVHSSEMVARSFGGKGDVWRPGPAELAEKSGTRRSTSRARSGRISSRRR